MLIARSIDMVRAVLRARTGCCQGGPSRGPAPAGGTWWTWWWLAVRQVLVCGYLVQRRGARRVLWVRHHPLFGVHGANERSACSSCGHGGWALVRAARCRKSGARCRCLLQSRGAGTSNAPSCRLTDRRRCRLGCGLRGRCYLHFCAAALTGRRKCWPGTQHTALWDSARVRPHIIVISSQYETLISRPTRRGPQRAAGARPGPQARRALRPQRRAAMSLLRR